MNISDVIEQFIIGVLGESGQINISRNEMAQYFDCAPSQINYVLSTRFSFERGYIIESKRGGGGFITIVRAETDGQDYLVLIDRKNGIGYNKAVQLLARMEEDGAISERDGVIIRAAVSDKAIVTPLADKDVLRANILHSILANLLNAPKI